MRLLWEESAWEDYLYRRINETNRIVYKEQEGALIIVACRGHYE